MNDFCRHFHGIHVSDTCDKGIEYKSVRHPEPPHRLPCFDPEIAHLCPLREGYTPEEIAEEQRELALFIERMAALMDGKSDICPHCGATIEHQEQVGRCVYARPCNCRLYQGKLSKGKQR